MRLRSYGLAAGIVALCFASDVQAANNNEQEGAYIAFNTFGVSLGDQDFTVSGAGTTELSYDFGYGLGAALGYSFGNGVRAEGEFAWRSNELDSSIASGDLDSFAGMVNGYYDIHNTSKWTPYVGAGIGLAHVTDSDVDDNVFAYQGMAGVGYTVSETSDLVLGYRYFATEDPEYTISGSTVETSYDTHNIEIAWRYRF